MRGAVNKRHSWKEKRTFWGWSQRASLTVEVKHDTAYIINFTKNRYFVNRGI